MFIIHPKTIQDLNIDTIISEKAMSDMRKKVHILVVDDDVQGRLDENLRRCGYQNVALMRDIERIQDVEPYTIVLVDICGVGSKLNADETSLPYEGLSLAAEIKRTYPIKKVIAFSARLQQFQDNYILRAVVDGSFTKDTNIEQRNIAIDHCVRESFDPKENWIRFRRQLLDADVPITEVTRMEDYYVRKLQKKSPIDVERLSSFMKNAALFIGAIKELVTVASYFK